MKRHPWTAVIVLAASSLATVGGALAQSYPTHFAPRCAPNELRVVPSPHDPCEPQMAFFGLKGPTVIERGERDVEATGSLRPDRSAPSKHDSAR
jgi:hypothetical protein